jgi:general stress protein 26
MTTDKRDRSDHAEPALPTQTKLEQLYGLIDGIEIAMMTTVNRDGLLVSRPMATQECSSQGGLWFVTNVDAQKLDELVDDPRVNLAYYKDRTREFVSISGLARLTQDRATIHRLHQPDWKMWFGDEGGVRDGGPNDPRIALIEVKPQSAVYLKADRPQPLVLFSLLKGMVTGEPPNVGEVGRLDRAELAQGRRGTE